MNESYWTYLKQKSEIELFPFQTKPGNTPVQTVEFLNRTIYLKREDLNPTGSVKDRGIAFQLASLIPHGNRHFVISSSGNAAISAATFCHQAQVKATVFVSPNTDESKIATLTGLHAEIIQDPRPVSAAFRFAKQHNAYNLRPSLDELGSVGYQTLGMELVNQLPQPPSTIFIPVSSGTTLAGMFEGLSITSTPQPQIHLVQTTAYHPIAQEYDSNFQPEDINLASGLVAKSIPRKLQIKQIITQSKGTGWVVSNQQIQEAYDFLHTQQIPIYYEAAATLAAFGKALQQNYQFPEGLVVCVLTGTNRTK